MAEFLLIHGACHGAWCWRDVLPFFDNGPHSATTIDLPSHGADTTPPETVTLDSYAQAIVAATEGASGPVVLVGHSMAGYAITAAALLAPERVARLIYLAAYLPLPGMGLADMRRAGPRQPLAPAIRRAEDAATFTFDAAMVPDLFYHDCPGESVDFAARMLCPQPIRPQETPLPSEPDLPRSYIICTEDRAIPPEYQTTMASRLAAEDRSTLPSSHSPFFSMPGPLAHRLMSLA